LRIFILDELNIKSAIEVAIKKDIEVPDEGSGLVSYYSSGSFDAKAVKVGAPSDKQLELINSKSLEPQTKDQWMIIKGVNPLGRGDEVDSHYDTFEPAAERDMAKQAFWTPVIINHSHDMNPPIGRCLEATYGKEGLRETWAIPIASYNAEYREALLQGNMPEISIGAFITPENKVCKSCGDKSIYSIDCPHIPGKLDPKTGTVTTVSIKRVKRYAERSLVNIPARMGTSVKSLEVTGESIKSDIEADLMGEVFNDELFEKGGLIPKPANAPIFEISNSEGSTVEQGESVTFDLTKGALVGVESEGYILYYRVTEKLTEQDPPIIVQLPLDYDEVLLQILVPEGKSLEGENSLGLQNFVTNKPGSAFKFNDIAYANAYIFSTEVGGAHIPQLKLDHRLFPDNESVNEGNFILTVLVSRKSVEDLGTSPPTTIPPVINEDSIVTEKDVKAPEAQEPSEKQEDAPVEAPAPEVTTEEAAPEVKEVEVPVIKSLEIEELTKAYKAETEATTKALTDKFNEVLEVQAKQAQDMGALTEALKTLTDEVAKAVALSSEETIEKLLEVASQLQDKVEAFSKKAAPSGPIPMGDMIDVLARQ
jgi:hypothetical protein